MIGQYVTAHGDVIAHVNITHVMVEDGGEYSCVVENRAGRSVHSARLNVYGLPYIRLIPKVTAVAGETLHLKCPVAGYPIEEVHWERGGRELPEDIRQKVQTDGSLIISPVQKKDDSGVYTCWARNKQGHSARRSGEVNVIGQYQLTICGEKCFRKSFRRNVSFLSFQPSTRSRLAWSFLWLQSFSSYTRKKK
jgi:Down syndrome cell adhesion molecule-like protein 1